MEIMNEFLNVQDVSSIIITKPRVNFTNILSQDFAPVHFVDFLCLIVKVGCKF